MESTGSKKVGVKGKVEKLPGSGGRNRYWVVVGGRLEGGMIFDSFKAAKAMYEFVECEHVGLKTLDQCEDYLEDRDVDTGVQSVRPGVLYPYYKKGDGRKWPWEEGYDGEKEEEELVQNRKSATAGTAADRERDTRKGEGAGADSENAQGFPEVVGYWTVTGLDWANDQEWATILCRSTEVEAKCKEWEGRDTEAFEHETMDLAITYLQIRGFPLPEPVKLPPIVYELFEDKGHKEGKVELATAEWKHTGRHFARQLPESVPDDGLGAFFAAEQRRSTPVKAHKNTIAQPTKSETGKAECR